MNAVRLIGTSLLALGFALLVTAVLIRDPVALDANIGAGILSMLGIPIGVVGIALIIADAIARAWSPKRPQSSDRSRVRR